MGCAVLTVLLLVKKFSFVPSGAWLFDDMVLSLIDKGHRVSVAFLDLSGEHSRSVERVTDKLTVFTYPVTARSMPLKVLQVVLGNIWLLLKIRTFEIKRYDLLLTSSVASLFLPFLYLSKALIKVRVRFLLLWDFFPIHHMEIGKVKKGLASRMLYGVEAHSVKSFDGVGLMSPKNIEFLGIRI
ncbi:hypothetical protein D5687_10785 [Guyparkeria sp. SCN-R1]|nr:hypothetical protein D5687_10785 [Guyparkeria sp. SCN-R1]